MSTNQTETKRIYEILEYLRDAVEIINKTDENPEVTILLETIDTLFTEED